MSDKIVMKRQSLTNNFFFQFAYQTIVLVIPLILSPYLTRVLQEEALGNYAYIQSIAYYFVIAANLGIGVYGKRLISRSSTDETQLRKSFWSLFITHAIVSVVVAVCYFLCVILFRPAHQIIYLIQGLYVMSALFDITWLFHGLENFKSVVIRNAAIKLIECILIFFFVKSQADLWIYTLIISLSGFLGHAVMLPQAISLLKPIKFSKQDIKQHIKPLFVFSLSVIAAALYTVFDKTLLGIFMTKADVAFYEYSNRIISVPQTFVGVIGMVMLPRVCKLVADGQNEEQKNYMIYSFYITAFIGMAAMFGICAVADELAVIYYGEAFSSCGKIMMALSPLAYIVGTGSVLRSQYLIPNGMDKQYNVCIIYNAVINLVLSVVLIPIIGVFGVVVGTLAAEVFGLVYQTRLCKRSIGWKTMIEPLVSFSIIGVVMFIIVRIIAGFMTISVSSLVIQVLVGALSYVIMSIGYLYIFKQDLLTILLAPILSKIQK